MCDNVVMFLRTIVELYSFDLPSSLVAESRRVRYSGWRLFHWFWHASRFQVKAELTDTARSRERLCTVAFTSDKLPPGEISGRLGEQGICCWSGNYYALRLMEKLGLEGAGGAVRIGPAHYNTMEEVDRLLECLAEML